MSSGFDPIAVRQRLNEDAVTGLQGTLARIKGNYDHQLEHGLIHNGVARNLYDVVTAKIVGADTLATKDLLSTLNDWAEQSLERCESDLPKFASEPGYPAFIKATSISNKLDSLWLSNQTRDAKLVDAYRDTIAAYVVDSGTAGDPMALELLVEKLASYGLWDSVTAQIKNFNTASGGKSLRPGTKALAALAAEPTAVDDANSPIRKQLVKWLAGNLESLLTAGSNVRVLQWLKIVEWREGRSGADTDRVLRTAYDYMKNVEPPADLVP